MSGKHHLSWAAESRKNYGEFKDSPNGSICRDQFVAGCMQRIATATEKMVENHDLILRDRDHLRASLQEEKALATKLLFQVRALKGAITRLKRAR